MIWLAVALGLWGPCLLRGAGLPEPDLVLYGTIRDVAGGLNVRLTAGSLRWTFQRGGGGTPITVVGTLTNINDQFSYVLRVPCERQVAGFVSSENKLTLGNAYDRAQVSVENQPATFIQVVQQTLSLTATDRGRIERVDLQVSIGGSGLLPEVWQLQYFGRTGIDPLDDPDGDGRDNLGEFLAGTNPLDTSSVFSIEIAAEAVGGPRLTWFSIAGRVYTLRRSTDLLVGFQDLAVNVQATPPLNSYQDATASGSGPYFYRVTANQAGQ